MKNEKGFSLLSVIVAMVLMGIGVLTMTNAMVRAQQLETRSDLRQAADVIANGYLEEILTRDPRTIISESSVIVDVDGNESETGAFTRTVTVEVARRVTLEGEEIDAKFLKRVTVRVAYFVAGKERQSRFTTLVYATES